MYTGGTTITGKSFEMLFDQSKLTTGMKKYGKGRKFSIGRRNFGARKGAGGVFDVALSIAKSGTYAS